MHIQFDTNKNEVYISAHSLTFCICKPAIEHDGNLDNYTSNNHHAEVRLTDKGIEIHAFGFGGGLIKLDVSQALSLSDWLVQERPTFKKLTQGMNK